MTFWIIIAAIALVVVAFLTRAALRGGNRTLDAAAYDIEIYRDQLKEVERDLARGVIGADEAQRVRVEVSRRILAADTQMKSVKNPDAPQVRSGLIVGVVALIAVLGGSLWLYNGLGQPGYDDLPMQTRIANSDALRANRMTQEQAEARLPEGMLPSPEVSDDFRDLMARLRETVANRPGDIQGLSLLARNEAIMGNMDAAIDAQQQLIELRGDNASAADYSYLAELLIGATGGYVSQEAEEALRTALEIDPRYPFARYYLAQYLMQVDRPDAAFRTLETLLAESPPDAPWVEAIRETIEEVAWRAGVNYELPPLSGGTGPSAADIAAAQDMSPEERNEMIRGMVSQLSQRLATEGGPPEEWARLIRALGILDDKDQANTIWSEAKEVFADDPSALRRLYSAAQDAEIAQ